MKIKFIIPGEPKPKQSARFRIVGSGKNAFVQSYQPKAVVQNSKQISASVLSQLPKGYELMDGAIGVKVHFVFPPLKSWSKKKLKELEDGAIIFKTTKPDMDNCLKPLADAMEGVVFTNDSRISIIHGAKIFGLEPRIEIELREL